jgi:hypothetical protein
MLSGSLRLLEAVAVVACAVWFVVDRKHFGWARRDSAEPALVGQRFADAVSRRERMEVGGEWFGVIVGVVFFASGLSIVLSSVNVTFVLAIDVFVYAAATAIRYASVRHRQPKRAASLRPRNANKTLPPAVYFPALAVALMPLWFLDVDKTLSLVVLSTALGTIGLAWAVANLPSRLTGDDPVADRIVDERMRIARSWNLLTVSVSLVYFFATQFGRHDGVHNLAFWLSWAAVMGLIFSRRALLGRPPSAG